MPYLTVPGGQLHYQVAGDAHLPALVFSNSLGADLTMWDTQVPVFARKFCVVRYDNRGHGASTFNVTPCSIADLGRDLLALLDRLHIMTFSFCGLSVGGMVGQWLGLHAPDRLRRLALCNTAARIGSAESWNERISAIQEGGIASVAPAILQRWFTPAFQRREPATVEAFREILVRTSAGSYTAICAAIRDQDFRAEIAQIAARTLVIAGAQDQSTPPQGGRFLAEQIAGARYVEFDCAHLSNVECAAKFSRELFDFVSS